MSSEICSSQRFLANLQFRNDTMRVKTNRTLRIWAINEKEAPMDQFNDTEITRAWKKAMAQDGIQKLLIACGRPLAP